MESPGPGPGLLGHAASLTKRHRPPGPGRPGPARRIALRTFGAFDRKFFRMAVIPAFLAVFLVTVIPFLASFGLSFSSLNSITTASFRPPWPTTKPFITIR